MGLGKSAQAIRACDLINAKRVGVICPSCAIINWAREFQRFSTTSRSCEPILSSECVVSPGSDTRITSPGLLLRNSVSGFFTDLDVLIVDEAHYYKELTAQRTQAVYGKRGVVRRARRTWLLTGTPMPNDPSELWPMAITFGLTKLGYDAWVERYCKTRHTPFGRQIAGSRTENIPELRALLRPFFIRRTKEEVMPDLPPILSELVYVPASEPDWQLAYPYEWITNSLTHIKEQYYRQIAAVEAICAVARDRPTPAIVQAEALSSLAESVPQLRRIHGLMKVQPVIDLVTNDMKSGMDKLVIFAHHKDVIEQLRDALKEFGPVVLYGGTSPSERQKRVDKFQNDPRCRIFIGNILAAGVAITLTAAHHVLMVEADWVPGNNAQAIMRCHRIGQTRTVNVRWVTIAGSVDEKIQKVLNRKTRDIVSVWD